jgi:replicative DNA helicase
VSGAEPRPQASRGSLRPVPPPDSQPPHHLEAEQAVLGAVLTAGRLLVEVAALVEEADYYRPAHRTIWRAILRLADRGQPTDPVTVLGELDHAGELADVGGGPFLHTLIQAVPTVANAAHYARLVAEAARRRRVIDLGIRMAHSDADPAYLAQLAGELAEATTAGRDGRGWTPPIPLGTVGTLPAFPVQVLPGWLGDQVAAVATATQTPPDLAGMLALAVLAAVAGGAVEVEARPGWQEPLCLFVAVGMDAGARKSSVFTAMTRPLADYERQQIAAALPAITETATRRRIAEQAAAHAEAAASKAPTDQAEAKQAEAVTRATEAANLLVPPLPRWLVDDATPEALAGLLATYGRIALLSPEGDVFDQMAGRYNPHQRPQPRRLPQRPRRRPAQGRPPRPPPRIRPAAVPDHRANRATRGAARAGRPARVRRPRPAGPVPLQPAPELGGSPPGRRPTRAAGGGRPLHPGAPGPCRQPHHHRRRADRPHLGPTSW